MAGGCGGDSLILPQEGEPSALVILGGDGQVDTVGRTLPDSLIIRITDPGDRPVRNQAVQFLEPVSQTGARIIPESAQTDADGRAKVLWVLGTVAGPQIIRARVTASGRNLAADFHANALAATPDTILTTSGDSQAGVVGSDLSQPLVARVTDRFGNPIGGVTAIWSPVGGGSVSPSITISDSNGQVAVRRTLGTAPGQQRASVAVPGLKGSPVGFVQMASQGQPASLIAESGNGQSGLPGQLLSSPLVVRLTDSLGNGIGGRAVVWPVAAGGGTITAAGTVTDAGGRASATWTLGPIAGPNFVIPSSSGFSATFTATSSPTQPAAISATSPLQLSGVAGGPALPAPSVRVTDAQGRAVAGVLVSFAVTAGGGSVVPSIVATDGNGNAAVGLWTLGPRTGANSLSVAASASGGSLGGSPVQFAAVAGPGPMSRLAIAGQPSSTGVSGVPLAQAPVLQLQDANGNDVGGTGVVITATIAGSPPGASLLSPLATTGASGRATFTGLALSAPAGTYALLFTSTPVLLGATSSGITISGALPTALSLSTQPSATVSSGQPFLRQPVLQLVDARGAPVRQAGVLCSVTLATGNPVLGGTLTAITDPAGVAAFSDLMIFGTPGQRTLRFTGPGLASVTSSAVNVSGSGASQTISIVIQPSASVINGAVFPLQPTVLVLDQNGLPVNGASVDAVVTGAGVTLAGPSRSTTNFLGIASFSGLSLTGIVGNYNLRLSVGAASAITATIDVLPGPASASTSIATVPTQGKTRRATVMTVQTRDQSGNDLRSGGHTVEVTVTGKNRAGPFLASDNGDGSYTASYTPTRKGNDLIAITLDGVPLAGSPFPSDVH